MSNPSLGLFSSMPFSQYQADGGLNFSSLKVIDESPEQFFIERAKDDESDDTDSLAFGRAYHHHVLEAKTFGQYFMVHRKITRRGAEWEKLKLIADTEGKQIVFEEEYETIRAMKLKLAQHALVPGLMGGADRELSLFWTQSWNRGNADAERCKARIDILNRDLHIAADLKTTESAHPRKFTSTIFDYQYHAQAAWYEHALRQCEVKIDYFVIIAQCKKPPYSIMVYELHPDVLEVGRVENQARLDKFFACKNAGIWPGYPEVAYRVTVPDWKIKQLQGPA